MKNTRILTEGALMLAIFAVLLLLSVFVPMAMIVTQFFLILPFLYYSAKYPIKNAALLVVGAILMSAMIGTLLTVPLAVLYGTTGTVMGYCVRTGKSKLISYLASSIVFLANIVLFFIIAVMLFEMNFMDEMISMFTESADQYTALLKSFGQTPDPNIHLQMQEMAGLMKALAPSLLVGGAFVTVILLMVINFPILKRLGIQVPQFPPFRCFKLPKSILWYYLITLVLSLAAKPDEGTYLYLVIVNATYILQLLLIIQGLALIFFYSHFNNWPKAIPIVAVIMTFMLPIFFSIVRLLGIIDLGFDLRKRLAKK